VEKNGLIGLAQVHEAGHPKNRFFSEICKSVNVEFGLKSTDFPKSINFVQNFVQNLIRAKR
jgi:hypothetical protein